MFPDPYVWRTLTINMDPHIHLLLIQRFLGGEPRYDYPKGYDQAQFLTETTDNLTITR